MIDLLLSVYELSGLSEEIYFDVNQKITSIISHIRNFALMKLKSVFQAIEIFQEIAMKL